MGLFGFGDKEPVYCWMCGKEIKGPRILITTTKSGKQICSRCEADKHLEDIRSKSPEMDDEEIELFLEAIKDSEKRGKDFVVTNQFKGYRLAVDQVHQCVKFDKHHYTFEIDEFVAIVHNLTLEGSSVTGTLQFHTINPYYPYIKVKVDSKAQGFFKDTKVKAVFSTLEEISAAIGGVPMLTPKEYSRCCKTLYVEKTAELEDNIDVLLKRAAEVLAEDEDV